MIYSDLPLAHIVCPAVPFNTAQALECFFNNKYFKHIMLPHLQSVAKTGNLVGHCLPCRDSASREAQPFPTKSTI